MEATSKVGGAALWAVTRPQREKARAAAYRVIRMVLEGKTPILRKCSDLRAKKVWRVASCIISPIRFDGIFCDGKSDSAFADQIDGEAAEPMATFVVL